MICADRFGSSLNLCSIVDGALGNPSILGGAQAYSSERGKAVPSGRSTSSVVLMTQSPYQFPPRRPLSTSRYLSIGMTRRAVYTV